MKKEAYKLESSVLFSGILNIILMMLSFLSVISSYIQILAPLQSGLIVRSG